MRDYLHLNADVERILIISVNGQVLFDSEELDDGAPRGEGAPERRIAEPARLEAVKRLEPTVLHGVDANGAKSLEIIAPYLEDWGRHKMSVAYEVSYKNLTPSIERLVYATGGLTLLSILISVVLAFTFGYAFTLGPVLRAGIPMKRALRLTFASDTVSITTMEIVDNAFILLVPGAIAAGLTDGLFWWSLLVSLAIAFVVTVPVNRWLIARGRGHAVVHELHAH
jgi:hypothetical protein